MEQELNNPTVAVVEAEASDQLQANQFQQQDFQFQSEVEDQVLVLGLTVQMEAHLLSMA